LPADSLVMIDGLALGAMPGVVRTHRDRLCMVGLVHHPLAAETGLSAELVSQLFESERRALQAMRLIVVTSQSTRRALDAYGVESHRSAVAEPGVDQPGVDQRGVDQPAVDRSANEILESHGRPYDASAPVRMLCVATITPRKGHDLLIDALADLASMNWT